MHITIDPQFNGPPGSGNGGYAAGLIASALGRLVRVRLRRPLPLGVELSLADAGPDEWNLMNGDEVLATATSASVDIDVPPSPGYAAALEASKSYPKPEDHDLPGCFVCGPGRAPGDGLRVFASAGPGTNLAAAAWTPDARFAEDGRIKPEFVWAALDCPGAFASRSDKYMLLGEIAARVDRTPRAGERCVVIGWPSDADGRKHKVGTALYGENDDLYAVALSTWIELKE